MNETPTPVYEVNLPVNPYYPWGLHLQVHHCKPGQAQGKFVLPCKNDDPDRIEGYGLFSVETTGPEYRGQHITIESAINGMMRQALASLKAGLYDPIYNGIPSEAFEIMVNVLNEVEKRTMLENPDLLFQTVEQLKQAVDAAVAQATREASQAVFGVTIPDSSPETWEAWTPRTIPVPELASAQ